MINNKHMMIELEKSESQEAHQIEPNTPVRRRSAQDVILKTT